MYQKVINSVAFTGKSVVMFGGLAMPLQSYRSLEFFRLISRIIFIPFESVKRSISDEEASIWQQMFDCLINKVSSVVGKIIALGEWVLTQEGRDFYNECVGIVLKGFGEEGRGTRFSKMWACGLLAARKV